MLDENAAVEVIHLVLQADGEQAVRRDFARMALAVLEETMALPAAMLDRCSFLALDAAYPFTADRRTAASI